MPEALLPGCCGAEPFEKNFFFFRAWFWRGGPCGLGGGAWA
jgi:hypothetical protein